MKKLLIVLIAFCSMIVMGQDKKAENAPQTDSIRVQPSKYQAEILNGLQGKIRLIQTELDRVNLEYETAVFMMLNVRKEDIVNLEIKDGVFIGLKKKQ